MRLEPILASRVCFWVRQIRNAISPDAARRGEAEGNVKLCPPIGKCNIGRTCADTIHRESAGEE